MISDVVKRWATAATTAAVVLASAHAAHAGDYQPQVDVGKAMTRLIREQVAQTQAYVRVATARYQVLILESRRAAQAEAERQAAEQARQAAAAAEEAKKPKYVRPADGVFTSGFGARWGTTHFGIDIANAIGTPIRSAADGVVVEAGPASGFGLWMRVRHADGTITVYGHVDRILISAGRAVKAGEQIATMGNRGESTGPHLHFEVWLGGSRKIDPLGWLNANGVRV
ncbi:Murein DD-endopeptidase MepM and murein hydrolase activator NlpD, contain LysM domain [Lentzea waywayandensis]|uniref:Murein DD-endopeptidase MepM and murein hydrolase activator NlpD, contain LysM domain n=1 Tax=Lentzea waywayandensis TaxID=84724 RepID=A0A1I6FJK1_9PSEU|nr:M23 family metallopeptidase [Lentzea waywayandensis]SFR30068.1 Murein DD-endopeptidase MepM and murein hydrolase activator NlpD, contain LysM domain [Lentzea waywayandensis]